MNLSQMRCIGTSATNCFPLPYYIENFPSQVCKRTNLIEQELWKCNEHRTLVFEG